VLLDMRSAVLMEAIDVVLVDTKTDDPVAMMMALRGRVNYADDRVEHAYLFGADGAAAIITEIAGLVGRAGSLGAQHGERFAAQFVAAYEQRREAMP
jgi:hypothetical protein